MIQRLAKLKRFARLRPGGFLKRTPLRSRSRRAAAVSRDDAAWAAVVKASWKNRCAMTGDDCRGSIEAHHLLGKLAYPALRFLYANGIALCTQHHRFCSRRSPHLAPRVFKAWFDKQWPGHWQKLIELARVKRSHVA